MIATRIPRYAGCGTAGSPSKRKRQTETLRFLSSAKDCMHHSSFWREIPSSFDAMDDMYASIGLTSAIGPASPAHLSHRGNDSSLSIPNDDTNQTTQLSIPTTDCARIQPVYPLRRPHHTFSNLLFLRVLDSHQRPTPSYGKDIDTTKQDVAFPNFADFAIWIQTQIFLM